MSSRPGRPSFDSPALQSHIRELRSVNNVTNWFYLAWEYLCIACVVCGAVAFGEWRGSLGIGWIWNVPVFTLSLIHI